MTGPPRKETPGPALVAVLFAAAGLLWLASERLDEMSRDAALSSSSNTAVEDPVLRLPDPAPHPTQVGVETLRGRVNAPSGLPLEGAEVRLGRQRTRTDAGGRFRLIHTADTLAVTLDGHFPLEVAADEHRRSPAASEPPGPEETTDPSARGKERGERNLVLVPGSRVKGRVSTIDGEAVPEARILLGQDLQGPSIETRSGPDGTWESPLLEARDTHVIARHPDFRTADRTVSLAPPGTEARLDLVLEGGEELDISVLDEEGSPVSDAHVWLDVRRLPGNPTGVESSYLGPTDDLGRIETRRDPDRAGDVRAWRAGYRETRRRVRGREVELALRPAPSIAARAISGRTGLPVQPLRVDLWRLHESEFVAAPHRGALFRPFTGGRVIVGLPPLAGTYRVSMTAAGDLRGISAPITFDGETSLPEVLVRLEPRPHVEGIVLADGKPLAGVEVRLLREDGERSMLLHGVPVPAPPREIDRRVSRADGRFSFPVTSEDVHRLAVERRGFAEFFSAPFSVALLGDREFPVVLRRGARLSGVVLDSEGGASLSSVPIVLTSSATRPRSTRSDARGAYAFVGLPPAPDYRVVIGSDGGAAEDDTSPIAIGEGESVVLDLRRRTATP